MVALAGIAKLKFVAWSQNVGVLFSGSNVQSAVIPSSAVMLFSVPIDHPPSGAVPFPASLGPSLPEPLPTALPCEPVPATAELLPPTPVPAIPQFRTVVTPPSQAFG